MLTKATKVTVVDPIPGTSAVPARTVCPPKTPDGSPLPAGQNGYYQTLCYTPSIYVGTYPNGIYVSAGAPFCSTVWVPYDS